MKRITDYFTKTEITIWCTSVLLIIAAFVLFDRQSYLTLAASLIGVTSLIFCAKGNPAGQVLMIVFSLLYGVISHGFAYYGEMITYLGMTMPMSVLSLIVWLKNPYEGKHSEVAVSRLDKKGAVEMCVLTVAVTVAFYFVLRKFGTANLLPSTLSVTTSFAAVFLTFKRSPYFALVYALNDLVLMVLWVLASLENTHYIAVVVCFAAFFANDIYGFINWKKMQKNQGVKP